MIINRWWVSVWVEYQFDYDYAAAAADEDYDDDGENDDNNDVYEGHKNDFVSTWW
jgi:hypothetical protein